MTRDTAMMWGVTLLLVPTIVYGGLTILGVLTRGAFGAPAPQTLSPPQVSLYRAGHAHAGVLAILSLAIQLALDHAVLPAALIWPLRIAALAVPLLVSRWFLRNGPRATAAGAALPRGLPPRPGHPLRRHRPHPLRGRRGSLTRSLAPDPRRPLWRALRVPGRVLARMASKRATTYFCPVQLTLDVVGGKWKPLILWLLQGGKKRFNDLLASMPGVTHKVLIQHLRELERDGIVERRVIGEPRVRVDYGLTEFGLTLKPSLDALASWAKRHHRRYGATILLYERRRRPPAESTDCPPVASKPPRNV